MRSAKGRDPSAAIALAHTALCAIPFAEIDKLCVSAPTLRQPLWCTLSQVSEDSQAHAMLPADKPAEQRIATFLMQLFDRKQTTGLAAEELELSMARADIANFLGLATETVSRWFTRLQQFNLLREWKPHRDSRVGGIAPDSRRPRRFTVEGPCPVRSTGALRPLPRPAPSSIFNRAIKEARATTAASRTR